MLYNIPKNKSFLRSTDLQIKPVMTKEKELEIYRTQKEKSAIDLMYDVCMKEMRDLHRNVGKWAKEDSQQDKGISKNNTISVAEARGKVVKRTADPSGLGGNKQKGIKTGKIFRTQAEEEAIHELMREAREAEKSRDITNNARELAKRELERHLNLIGDDEDATSKRMQKIDHHLYLDEASSAGPPDPSENPDKIKYAPVRTPADQEPNKDLEDEHEIERLTIALPKQLQSRSQSKKKISKKMSSKIRHGSPKGSAAGSTAVATGDEQDDLSDFVTFEKLTPFTAQGEFHISNTWSLNPLSEMSFDEKQILKAASRREMKKFAEQANKRYGESKSKSLMLSDSDHNIRNAAMRRIVVHQLKQEHMHDF